jgi:hypothetical protein
MGLHHPFGHLKHKLWPKKGPRVKLTIWLPTTKSQKIDPIFLRTSGVRHTVKIFSTRVTTLLQTSSPSEVCTWSYGLPKLQESQPWQFRDSHLGVPRQKAIWMWAPWAATEYIIRGKVVASPKSRPRWVLWIRVARGSS